MHADDPKAPIHATHRLDFGVYIDVDSDYQAEEIIKFFRDRLYEFQEVIRTDADGVRVNQP